MIQLILLIMGIVYAVRRPKLKALAVSDYPDVTSEQFGEWRELELKSIDMFLWATWGLLLLGTPVVVAVVFAVPESAVLVQVAYLVIFLIMLGFSAIAGSKAASLKKQLGITWPK